MVQKPIVSLPSNVCAFRYNSFSRDFDGYELDFGTVAFRRDLPAHGSAPLICIYDTTQDEPMWYLEKLASSGGEPL